MIKNWSRAFLVSICTVLALSLDAQMYDPVDWSFELIQEAGSNEAELVFTARIDEGWHLYSQFLSPSTSTLHPQPCFHKSC